MENQPQNPELRVNPESFHPCAYNAAFHQRLHCLLRQNQSSGTEIHNFIESLTDNPLKYKLDYSIISVLICMG